MKFKNKRFYIKQGMALPIVLAFAIIMGVVSLFLIKTAKNTNAQIVVSMDQLQSYFVARAGAEHIALKVKYLNSNLYDAFCIQQGRNPYFNFSLVTNLDSPWTCINEYNPGPIFLYKSGDGIKRDKLFSNMGTKTEYFQWVNTFKEDLQDLSIADTMPDSFVEEVKKSNFFTKATYRLTKLDLAASQLTKIAAAEGKPEIIKNDMIVEFTVESSILSIKNTAEGNDDTFNYEIKKSLKVSKEH